MAKDTLSNRVRYSLQTLLVKSAYGLFGLLPFTVASGFGGWIGRTLGPRMSRTRIAKRNMRRALPHLTDAEIERYTLEMWDNIGRIFAEFPHMAGLSESDIHKLAVFEGIEHIKAAGSGGKLLFTAHNGNWEFAAKSFFFAGYPLHIVFREGNNPGLAQVIDALRNRYIAGAIPKSREGAKTMIEVLKAGGRIGMLMDQKMNDGIEVPFFGRGAMTAPAIARLALKYDYPIFPVRVIRTGGLRHKVIIYPALSMPVTGDTHRDVYEIMLRINAIIEGWIREYPGQWYWLHNRWPDSKE